MSLNIRYSARLAAPLEADATALPLSAKDAERLRAQLPSGQSTLLVLKDDVNSEEVEVGNQAGKLYLAGRGLGGTVPRKFPRGSALCFEFTVELINRMSTGWLPLVPGEWPEADRAAEEWHARFRQAVLAVICEEGIGQDGSDLDELGPEGPDGSGSGE
jgi:hypothetical protein